MGRVLSIDFGQKRTGIAVTDPLQLIAGGLVTVATSELYSFLVDYISKEDVERLIIGFPTQMSGAPSDNLKRIELFVARWKKHQTIPIEYYDERFTSVLAQQTMRQAGLKKKARQNKELVDEISATIILQDWMKQKDRKKTS